VIDLHCHILPGVDDGSPDLPTSLAMARLAAADGIRTTAATPHIRDDHPFDYASIPSRVAEVNAAIAADGIELEVVAGAELALSKVPELDDEQLAGLCLGESRCLLVESPYTLATDLLERDLFDIQVRGFAPLLAHPERSPSFLKDPARLATLVERGVLCSVTSASLAGKFGKHVQRMALRMAREGIAHDIASDGHGPEGRRPTLRPGLEALERELRGRGEHGRWAAHDVPAAILAGEPLPDPPRPARARRRLGFGR
jgi:protein-tyrosine phosphatase